MKKIKIDIKSSSYGIFVKAGILDNIERVISFDSYDRIFVLTDRRLIQLYSKSNFFQLDFDVIQIEGSEQDKNIDNISCIISDLMERGCSRNSLIIGMGGGVITDMVGFIASIFMRGVDHILIPTTLLGMVDASIGGKTGINTQKGKNIIGTFKQPERVIIDPIFLNTLNSDQIINGLAEVIKYGLICDDKLFSYIQENLDLLIELKDLSKIEEIIIVCCNHKKTFVMNDELDKNKRMLLNFGHTFGHALESFYNYEKIQHGEAVYYGMAAAAYLSYKLGYISKGELDGITSLLFQIPKVKIEQVNIDEIMEIMQYDKKNGWNNNCFIVLKNIGEACIVKNVSSNDIRESLTYTIKKI